MKTALFVNFTSEDFIGYWDGKGKKIKAGESIYMPDYLARHFARHLVNRELLRKDSNGNLIHLNGEKFTSPKRPEDVPIYTELFNKACVPDSNEIMGDKKDDIDTLINVANKNRQSDADLKAQAAKTVKPNEPQVILSPDYDEEDDDEASFAGKPVENAPQQ